MCSEYETVGADLGAPVALGPVRRRRLPACTIFNLILRFPGIQAIGELARGIRSQGPLQEDAGGAL
jgi:hypothetical protein